MTPENRFYKSAARFLDGLLILATILSIALLVALVFAIVNGDFR